MKADAMSFTFLGNEGIVKIPFFQRGYVWDSTNWEDMLIDLFDEQKSLFLGSLILKQQERQTGKSKEVLVIDGQQRLTTLSVLIKVLYDSFSVETKQNCESSIRSYLFFKRNQTDNKYFVKIQHSRIDAIYYQQVIESTIDKASYDKINETSNKILQCYKFFSEELKLKTPKDRENLFNRILDNENKILVIIDLTEKEDEQAIFDTINSAGVRLSGADIVKNSLFQRAIEVLDSQEDVISKYTKYWENIFLKDDDAILFWSTPRATGRLMRDNIEILLHSVAVIKGFFDPDKHTLSDLSVLYKSSISKYTKDELISFIIEFANYAKLYREKILVFDKSSLFTFSDNVQRLFHILDTCEISTFHPYILHLLHRYENDTEKLNINLAKIEKYIIRRMITKQETKSYNKICKEFILNETSIDSKSTEISDSEVLKGLMSIGKNKNAALLLFWVELYRRHNEAKFSIKDLKYNYSLEHVMPQKWEEYWANVPVKDKTGMVITNKEDAKKERYSKIYSLGNMTLLTSSLNSSLKNYSFEKKINGEAKKRGMKMYADLSITSIDIIEPFTKGDLVWDEDKMNQRTINLGSEILKIW